MGHSVYPLVVILLAPALAAAHPQRAVVREGMAQRFEIVADPPDPRGNVLARQVLPPAAAAPGAKAQSRVIYLNHHGTTLHPGANDSATQTSSIVTEETTVGGWDIDPGSWDQLVGCVQDMYRRWDVQVTDQDPGAGVAHIEALIGGSPLDLGLPDNVAGISPFTEDCGVVERSIVFTFTDILDDNPQLVCEIISQEIAHSFGLDHEMLAEDPMTYLDYAGPRSFQDSMAHCGEFDQRDCGINGNVCRKMQSSVQMLTARLGLAGEPGTTTAQAAAAPTPGGCDAGRGAGSPAGLALVSLALALGSRRRTRLA
jgi:hypothetical protein